MKMKTMKFFRVRWTGLMKRVKKLRNVNFGDRNQRQSQLINKSVKMFMIKGGKIQL